MKTEEKGFLVLEPDSNPKSANNKERVFPGILFGARISAETMLSEKADRGYGEVVFNTSMVGYQEILTDPSYCGEIITMTTPHIGNTGVNDEDEESKRLWCAGFVLNELCERRSNWRSNNELHQYLEENFIPGIKRVDTRALTLELRTRGVTRGVIVGEKEKDRAIELLRSLPRFENRDLVSIVSTPKPYSLKPKSSRFKVAVLDFGVKKSLLHNLQERGCELSVFPCTTSAEEILSSHFDGVFLSNGPGDPTAVGFGVTTVQKLLGKLPLFGICMGHQLLCLALGGSTFKLKFGHRGGNQPVYDKTADRVEISSHNHGYSVKADTLPRDVEVTHTNLNDQTVEGIAVPKKMAFSVQYHPEAAPGPHDSYGLFDRFIQMLEKYKK